MIKDMNFWKNIVCAWISVQTTEEKKKTLTFAEKLAQKQSESKREKPKSIYDELFGEEE